MEEKVKKNQEEKIDENKETVENNTTKEAAEAAADQKAVEAETEEQDTEAAPEEAAAEETAEELLIAENEALKEELEEKEDRILRLQAEFDNFRRRTVKEKEELRKNAAGDVLTDLLPVLDNFDRALVHAEDSPMLEGIVMIHKQLLDILGRAGLEKAGAPGEPFDPKYHDAVMQEPSDEMESGMILEVLQPGYKFGDKLLRAAMVKVAE